MTLPKIRNEDKESKFGYVYAVSGPGKKFKKKLLDLKLLEFVYNFSFNFNFLIT